MNMYEGKNKMKKNSLPFLPKQYLLANKKKRVAILVDKDWIIPEGINYREETNSSARLHFQT